MAAQIRARHFGCPCTQLGHNSGNRDSLTFGKIWARGLLIHSISPEQTISEECCALNGVFNDIYDREEVEQMRQMLQMLMMRIHW